MEIYNEKLRERFGESAVADGGNAAGKRKRIRMKVVRRVRKRYNPDTEREEEEEVEEEEETVESCTSSEGDDADLPPALLKARKDARAKKARESENASDAGESGSDESDDASSSSESSVDDEGNKRIKKSRHPISELGKLYFEGKVLNHSGQRNLKKGIVAVDCSSRTAEMYDRGGKPFSTTPYSLRNEIPSLKMGEDVQLRTKKVRLGPAVTETEYLHGAFFLRKNERRKEIQKQRKRAEEKEIRRAALAETNHLSHTGVDMSFGANMVSRTSGLLSAFRPRKLRIYKSRGPNYSLEKKKDAADSYVMPQYCPDREKAVLLFRAEYKQDSARRKLYNVVVDPVIGDKLRPHQVIGVKFMWDCITGVRVPGYYGCILADEMGLGKSIQAITLLWTALHQSKYGAPLAKKAIVVAPSSLVDNWCNEFKKWLPLPPEDEEGNGEPPLIPEHMQLNPCAIGQSSAKSGRILNAFEQDATRRVLVISYDQLRKYENRIKDMSQVGLVICDEGHRLKNAEIKTTKAVDMVPTTRRVILSGTPLQNDLGEFHAMVNFCNPGVVGNIKTFTNVFKDPIMAGREPTCGEPEKILGGSRAYFLATLTNSFILQRKATVNEKYLPSKIEQTVFVKPSELQNKIYESIVENRDDLIDAEDDEDAEKESKGTALVTINSLKKLCNHPDMIFEIIQETGKMKKVKAAYPRGYKIHQNKQGVCGKLDFVAGLLKELKAMPVRTRDKVVIVSNYTQTLYVIAALCEAMDVKYFQLDGGTPIKKRQSLVDMFNIPGSSEIVFLLSSKAGGVGLNLIGANRLILYDPDWNPANDAQAMGRVWRDGQKKKVFIYRLLTTGTIEEKVYQRQVSKQGLSANIMDATDKSKQQFRNNDLKALFVLKKDTVSETHDLLGCKCCMSAADREEEKKDPRYRPFKTHARSGPRMDELKGWKHLASADDGNDDVLKRFATGIVSFIFANERESQREQQLVEDTKGFTADAAAITCGDDKDDDSDDISVDEDDDGDDDDDDEEEEED
eukprot:TRINITY_DN73098_c0_g1_i1.p1 TRINITY_DN73098_c0_g1~~TRINITY_DN73098_c0_g1_i1.p1  ORF type:complete len:1095 (+),score=464.44 TRINITY_DN73098_c0_g1_i1:226-3285(+)